MTSQSSNQLGRRTWRPYLIVAAVLVLAAVVLTYAIGRRSAPRTLRIGYSAYSVNLPLFVAVDERIFETHGLRVTLTPFQSTDQMAAALLSRQIDVASALTAEAVYSANNSTADVLRPFYFNTFSAATSVDAIVVLPSSDIRSLDALKKRKLGILPANMMKVALRAQLTKLQVDPDSVELVTLPPSSVLSALAGRSVDACYILEPLVTVAQQKMQARIVVSGLAAQGIADPLPAGFHCARTELLQSDPDLSAILIRAYSQGTARAADRSVAVALLKKYCALEPSVASAVALPTWSAWTDQMQHSLQAQFDALKQSQAWDAAVFDKTRYVRP